METQQNSSGTWFGIIIVLLLLALTFFLTRGNSVQETQTPIEQQTLQENTEVAEPATEENVLELETEIQVQADSIEQELETLTNELDALILEI